MRVPENMPQLTVRQLIQELEKMPPDAPVMVEGYRRAEESDIAYVPNYVEAIIDGDGSASVILWAMELPPEDYEKVFG